MVPGKNVDLEPRHLGSVKCSKLTCTSDQRSHLGWAQGRCWIVEAIIWNIACDSAAV